MSVRRGIAGLLPGGHQVDEPVEQVGGVVRAGGSLGVVLHRERRQVQARQALDHVVVEVDVGDHDPRRTGRRRAARSASPVSGASTAKPWLCAVISTLPVRRSITGWLIPRWP